MATGKEFGVMVLKFQSLVRRCEGKFCNYGGTLKVIIIEIFYFIPLISFVEHVSAMQIFDLFTHRSMILEQYKRYPGGTIRTQTLLLYHRRPFNNHSEDHIGANKWLFIQCFLLFSNGSAFSPEI